MPRYAVLLRSDEATTATRLDYEADEEVAVGDVIDVCGLRILVDGVERAGGDAAVLECRRLWKLRLRGGDGRPLGPGFILNEQRHFGDVETLVLDRGERYRLVRVEEEWPPGFDGALVLERWPLGDDAARV